MGLDEPEENKWVNPYGVSAKGPGGKYTVADVGVQTGMHYHYRLFGFDETGQLSHAYQVSLDGEGGPLSGETAPSCLYMPYVQK